MSEIKAERKGSDSLRLDRLTRRASLILLKRKDTSEKTGSVIVTSSSSHQISANYHSFSNDYTPLMAAPSTPPTPSSNLSTSLPSPQSLRELKESGKKKQMSLSNMLLRGSTPNLSALISPRFSEKDKDKEKDKDHQKKTSVTEMALSPRGPFNNSTSDLTQDLEDYRLDPEAEDLRKEAIRLLVSDMRLIGALGEAVASDEHAGAKDMTSITEALLEIFSSENQTLRLLEGAISREITKQMNKTDEINTLFRSNNLSCKLLSCYFRNECKKYLKDKVGALVKEAVSHSTSTHYEVDKSRLTDSSLYEKNLNRLHELTSRIIDSLCSNPNDFPLSCRRLCWYLKNEICFHFPNMAEESVNVILNGMVFLRLFCPAVLTPMAYGILEADPGPESSRTLLLISKVLLASANGTQFGSNSMESGLSPLNPFIKQKKTSIDEFLKFQSVMPVEDGIISPSQFEAKHFRKDKIDLAMDDWIFGSDSIRKKSVARCFGHAIALFPAVQGYNLSSGRA
eukprot:TRINITY_DN1732_c0_g1_i3.p1 TRINITY_DN1732_c0_g1~~TRINITY_DN1732_c0_g1_i3.p1  ORF type:complete len:511 (+),score=83.81 TRINITY_DN1732_c0_g1_i3:385-1917(+)